MFQGKELQGVGRDLATERPQRAFHRQMGNKIQIPYGFHALSAPVACTPNSQEALSPPSSNLAHRVPPPLEVPQPYQVPPDPSRVTFIPATGPLHLPLPKRKAGSSTSSTHPAPPHTELCAVSSKGNLLFLGGVRSPGPWEVSLGEHQNLLEGRKEGGKEGGRGEELGKERGLSEDGKSGRWAGAPWGGHPHLLQPWAGLGEWAQPFLGGGRSGDWVSQGD